MNNLITLKLIIASMMSLLISEGYGQIKAIQDHHNFVNSVGQKMIWVPPSHDKENGIQLTKGFWVSEFEISFAEIGKVFTKNDYAKRKGVAVGFSYFQASKFCKTLTEIAKHNRVFLEGYRYCLPTEAQWRHSVDIAGKKLGISKKNVDTLEWCSDVFGEKMATGKNPEKTAFNNLQSVRVVVRGSGESRGSAEPWIKSESATFRVVLVKD